MPCDAERIGIRMQDCIHCLAIKLLAFAFKIVTDANNIAWTLVVKKVKTRQGTAQKIAHNSFPTDILANFLPVLDFPYLQIQQTKTRWNSEALPNNIFGVFKVLKQQARD